LRRTPGVVPPSQGLCTDFSALTHTHACRSLYTCKERRGVQLHYGRRAS
jgi:hypothetical protein